MINHKSQIINQKSQKSWHHRMARLIPDAYYPPCSARACTRAAIFICEWDQRGNMLNRRLGRMVSRHKLCCADHAANFAAKHGIYMADLPDVKLSQLETASRDDWRYSDQNMNHEGHEEARRNNSVPSVLSVAQNQSEER